MLLTYPPCSHTTSVWYRPYITYATVFGTDLMSPYTADIELKCRRICLCAVLCHDLKLFDTDLSNTPPCLLGRPTYRISPTLSGRLPYDRRPSVSYLPYAVRCNAGRWKKLDFL